MVLKIAICDDDTNAAKQIKELAESVCPRASTIYIFNSSEELLSSAEIFDIIFIDIQMGEINGIEAAKILRGRNSQNSISQNGFSPFIIFITNHGQYMPDAFDVQAFHYLLKPLDKSKFISVFEKAVAVLKSKEKSETIIIKNENNIDIPIEINSINYIESNNKNVIIHTANAIIESRGQMAKWELLLTDNFFRCHRGFIINLNCVAGFNKNTVFLLNGEEVLLSKKYYSAIGHALVKNEVLYGKNIHG